MTKSKSNKNSGTKKKAGKGQRQQQRGGVTNTTVAPRAFVGNMGNNPRMRPTDNGVYVTNTEAFTPVTSGATAALVVRTALVPCAMAWLSRIAGAYSKYRWKRLRIFYLTQVSTSTEGRFAMGLSYDPIDNVLGTVDQVVSLNRSTFGPVWAGQGGFDSGNPFAPKNGLVCLDLDTTKLAKPWYNYATQENLAAMDNAERGVYVPALLSIGLDGIAGTKTVGSIYVSYEIELIEPTPGQ